MIKPHEERRVHFRVDMVQEIHGKAKILSVNDQEMAMEKALEISILDLSGGGLRAIIPLNLPVQFKIILNVSFELKNEPFYFYAQVLRKNEKNGKFEYGMKFLHSSFRDEDRLVRSLNQYKLEHVKQNRSQNDLRRQKYIGSLVKILEAFPEPAYLVTYRRIVVAANKAAQAKGIKLGERCHQTICQHRTVCPHCRMDESITSEGIVSRDAMVLGTDCLVHWLNLEEGLILHYFIKVAQAANHGTGIQRINKTFSAI